MLLFPKAGLDGCFFPLAIQGLYRIKGLYFCQGQNRLQGNDPLIGGQVIQFEKGKSAPKETGFRKGKRKTSAKEAKYLKIKAL